MDCKKCYHYQACANIDVTGYVADPNNNAEETCDHFLNPEDVTPTAHWVRRVRPQKWLPNVDVGYECSRCGIRSERVYSREIIDKKIWDEYMRRHWMPKTHLCSYCHGCGAKMDLDKTDHTNRVVND